MSAIDDTNLRESLRDFENHQELKNPDPNYRYHTFFRRTIALMIDGLIFFAISYLSSLISQSSPIMGLVAYILIIAYLTIAVNKFGTTLGKSITKVHVVSFPDEQAVTIQNALLRNVMLILSLLLMTISVISLSLYYSIMFAAMWLLLALGIIDISFAAFSRNRRSLHDRISHTVCIIKIREDLKL